MKYGFIYLLANVAMPCYYKIGCTERAPHERAEELSRTTSVPEPFRVLLYIEVPDFQMRERALHGHLGDFRPNSQREFFLFGPRHMPWVFSIFHCYPEAVSFCECGWEGDLEEAFKHPDPWVTDPDPSVPDRLYLEGPNTPPIESGELRLVA